MPASHKALRASVVSNERYFPPENFGQSLIFANDQDDDEGELDA